MGVWIQYPPFLREKLGTSSEGRKAPRRIAWISADGVAHAHTGRGDPHQRYFPLLASVDIFPKCLSIAKPVNGNLGTWRDFPVARYHNLSLALRFRDEGRSPGLPVMDELEGTKHMPLHRDLTR